MSLAVAIMAAGAASRFGSCKHLAMLGGETLLERQLRVCQQAFDAHTVIVTGCHHAAIAQHIDTAPCIFNPHWQQGLGNSIAFATSHLHNYQALAIVLADQIALTVADLQQLHRASQDCGISCATYQNKRGVPAIFQQPHFAQLQQLQGDKGAKALLQDSNTIAEVDMPNAAIDIDTQADLFKANQQLGLS